MPADPDGELIGDEEWQPAASACCRRADDDFVASLMRRSPSREIRLVDRPAPRRHRQQAGRLDSEYVEPRRKAEELSQDGWRVRAARL